MRQDIHDSFLTVEYLIILSLIIIQMKNNMMVTSFFT